MRIIVFVLSVLAATMAYAQPSTPLSIAGDWSFRLDPQNEGLNQHWQDTAFTETVRLPGSLDENAKGTPNNEASRSYLSRRYTYVGPAWFQRDIEIPGAWQGRAIEVFLERCHWESRLWVDGRPAGLQDSLCTPHVYNLGALTPGRHRLALRIDNSVKYAVGLRAHSITEHTQTNWNGVIGRMELRALPEVHIGDVQVHPDIETHSATVRVVLDSTLEKTLQARVTVSALGATSMAQVPLRAGGTAVAELRLDLGERAPRWDEFDPRLIDLSVQAVAEVGEGSCHDTREVQFGHREFSRNGTEFTLNGRPYYVRGTLECCIFPLTGYPAMDVPHWRSMMETARQYGLNHFRFHSWCPPEAAFVAADQLGFTLQVETPVWTDLGKFPDLDQFIHDEASRILRAYGNHPSFVMLAVGNEPSGPNKDAFLTQIVAEWQQRDPRRLYSTCAGWPELPVSDFHIVHERNNKLPYRLHRGPLGPFTNFDYAPVLAGSERPAIAHELGQWCVYPDYTEIPNYTGVLRARNLEGFRASLARNGMLDQAADFARASGMLQRLMYKADIEAMLRTPGAAGFQLLALQDFPGQGSALEGFVDAFWNSKGVITSDDFRQFSGETVPLLALDKFVWRTSEMFIAKALVTHFGPAAISPAQPAWSVSNADGGVLSQGAWPACDIPLGSAQPLGEIRWPLDQVEAPGKLTVSVFLAGTPFRNTWDIHVYPAASPDPDTGRVRIAHEWSPELARALRRGESILLQPDHIAPGHRVSSAFEPIFWNTQWFPGQDRQLGIFCDPRHPAFASFPNDGYSDWQWWELLNGSTVLRLDQVAADFRPLVQVVDDWNKNRLLGAVFEARVGRGKLLVSTLDITSDLQHRPVAAALRNSMLAYMESKEFAPQQRLGVAWCERVFAPGESPVAQIEAESADRDHAPENLLDGDPGTSWQSTEGAGEGQPAHEIRVMFTSETELTGITCTPATGAAAGVLGRCVVYPANDGRNWGPPLADSAWKASTEEYTLQFDKPVKTRWLRLVLYPGAEAGKAVSLADLTFHSIPTSSRTQ